MPPSRHRLHLLLIPVAGLIAITPLLRNGPSCGHDFPFHLLSWLEAAGQFSHGNLHPHWAYTPAYDAGEPRFIFYPPLSWTIGGLLTLALSHLPHITPDRAFNLAPILYTWIALTAAGLAMHALARRYTSPNIALLVATLYLANPYTLFTAFERTAFAELLAAAWIPLLLLVILPPDVLSSPPERPQSLSPRPENPKHLSSRPDPERAERVEGAGEGPASPNFPIPKTLSSRPKARSAAVEGPASTPHIHLPNITRLALIIALLWLTNAPAAVMGCYTLALLAVLHISFLYRERRSLRPLLAPAAQLTAGTFLGLALAAFYILPAAFERRWVEINLANVPGMRISDNTLFHHTPDPDHNAVVHTVSLIALLLLILTAAALLSALLIERLQTTREASSRPEAQPERRDPRISPPSPNTKRPPPINANLLSALALPTALIALLLTPLSAPIWRFSPELNFLQFPWRFLAILAPICALSVALTLRRFHLRGPIAVTLALLLPAALTLAAYPAFRQTCEPAYTPQAQLATFHSTHGSDPTDEYTPTTADNDVLRSDNPAWTLLPSPPATPRLAGLAPTHLSLDLTTSEILVFNLRDYPAWRVTRNGSVLTDRVQRDDGLLAITLPPGHSDIDLNLRSTPDQIAGDAISLAALCVFLPLAAVSLRKHRDPPSPVPTRSFIIEPS